MNWFNLHYLFLGSLSKYSHTGGLVFTYELLGDTNIQSISPSDTQDNDISIVEMVKGPEWKWGVHATLRVV